MSAAFLINEIRLTTILCFYQCNKRQQGRDARKANDSSFHDAIIKMLAIKRVVNLPKERQTRTQGSRQERQESHLARLSRCLSSTLPGPTVLSQANLSANRAVSRSPANQSFRRPCLCLSRLSFVARTLSDNPDSGRADTRPCCPLWQADDGRRRNGESPAYRVFVGRARPWKTYVLNEFRIRLDIGGV